MAVSAHNVAALLGSRICHDLISPLGAISNGVELLQMSGGQLGPEIDLISESVENANARIRFFRVAFGAASPGQMIGGAEIATILDDLNKGARISFSWRAAGDAPRTEAKLAFLMVLCLETALPWGGEITVDVDGTRWSVQGRGERMKLDPPLWEALSRPGAEAEIGAAEVQFLLLPMLIAEAGRSLSVEISEQAISARF